MAKGTGAAASRQVMRAPGAGIPRDYNFAADILGRNLDAGRGSKSVFIDARRTWTWPLRPGPTPTP